MSLSSLSALDTVLASINGVRFTVNAVQFNVGRGHQQVIFNMEGLGRFWNYSDFTRGKLYPFRGKLNLVYLTWKDIMKFPQAFIGYRLCLIDVNGKSVVAEQDSRDPLSFQVKLAYFGDYQTKVLPPKYTH